MGSSRHFRLSPLALLAIMAIGAVAGFAQGGYFKDAFHQDILASVNPAEVLTPADMISRSAAATPTVKSDGTGL